MLLAALIGWLGGGGLPTGKGLSIILLLVQKLLAAAHSHHARVFEIVLPAAVEALRTQQDWAINVRDTTGFTLDPWVIRGLLHSLSGTHTQSA